MKVFVALCLMAVMAQAIDIDLDNIKTMEVVPANVARLLEENQFTVPTGVGRVVGGVEATPGQFPYQVGLFLEMAAGTSFCGGSILNEEWILTAAHCVESISSAVVVVGAHDMVRRLDAGTRVNAKRWFTHEDWNSATLRNDIALILLEEPLEFSDRVQPTRLPTRSQASETFVNEIATVSGWGKATDSATGISPVLRYATNPILAHRSCNIRYLGVVGESHICLSGSNRRSSCSGDSGGPLVITEADGERTQVGLVSFGLSIGCSIGWPGVYTRLTSYLDWIETNTDGAIQIRD